MKVFASMVLLTAVFLGGCKSTDSNVDPEMDMLNYKTPGVSSGLSVSLVALKDNRCPQNVICIQPGWVELLLSVKEKTDSVEVESIFHGDTGKNKPKRFRLGSNNYTLTVEKVVPLPVEGKKLKIEDYTIGVSVVPQ